MITDAEIIELEKLLQEQKRYELFSGLENFTEKTSPNYKFLFNALNSQKWQKDELGRIKLVDGFSGVALEGSSRSTKTWSGVDFIIYLGAIKHKEKGCTINIYRETYNEFKTTLYDDFKRRLDDFGLPNPFHNAKEVPSFKIGKTTIHFLGDGKHGGGCDYAFFNEAMMISQEVFRQVTQRCRIFWWMDYNPSFTQHWVFDNVLPRPDVGFLRTTFKDNPYISPTELNTIIGYEPWQSDSYEVTEDGVFYNGQPITENNQPPPHLENVENGTADEFMWKCYGLGLRGAMKGVIFPNVSYIDEFPEDLPFIYGNDFGFTADPNSTVKYCETEEEIFVELLIYKPIETAELLSQEFLNVGINYELPIICDSSDKRVSEKNGVINMVNDLIEIGWKASKVKKNKSVTYWVSSMKNKKRINIVKDKAGLWKKAKLEAENYIWMEIQGIQINQPIDKYNHFWDSTRYCHMVWNQSIEFEAEWNE